MPIPDAYAMRHVYHFTHIMNLPGILERGLLSTNEKRRLGINHNAIAYQEIQCRRATMQIPCGRGGVVHDYVPLYFCIRSPMLHAVMTNKIADEQFIIYLEFPISIMDRFHFVFSDASANTNTPPNFFDDPSRLDRVNWDAVDTWRWGGRHDVAGQPPVRQAKMAELLIHNSLEIAAANRIIVWNESIENLVKEHFSKAEIPCPPISIGRRDYYYLDNGYPPVTGPYFIKEEYQKTVGRINSASGERNQYNFADLRQLLRGIEENFGCISETEELIGLLSENIMHNQDVGEHTLRVVQNLYDLPEYIQLTPNGKVLVKLAAYLHDIGKGPKSRWEENGGRQKVDPDHPIRALPMLERILVEEVEQKSIRAVKKLCKLVCYHDLIGDIIGRGRRVEELEEVIEDEQELDMLIALSKADIMALDAGWENGEKMNQLHQRVLQYLCEQEEE